MKPRGVPGLTVTYRCPTCHDGTWTVTVDVDGCVIDELSGCRYRSCWDAAARGYHDDAMSDALTGLLDLQRVSDGQEVMYS